MMEKYINDCGKECWRGVEESSEFDPNKFHRPDYQALDGENWAFHTNLGSLTVVDRMTGFGFRDTETGYRALDGTFWLASGNYDVMSSGVKTVGEAIEWVKARANTCVAYKREATK